MAITKNDDAAARRVVAERITVGLLPKTIDELQALQERTGLPRAELVNRAITLYAFLDGQTNAGYELLRRRADGADELELVRFL